MIFRVPNVPISKKKAAMHSIILFIDSGNFSSHQIIWHFSTISFDIYSYLYIVLCTNVSKNV